MARQRQPGRSRYRYCPLQAPSAPLQRPRHRSSGQHGAIQRHSSAKAIHATGSSPQRPPQANNVELPPVSSFRVPVPAPCLALGPGPSYRSPVCAWKLGHLMPASARVPVHVRSTQTAWCILALVPSKCLVSSSPQTPLFPLPQTLVSPRWFVTLPRISGWATVRQAAGTDKHRARWQASIPTVLCSHRGLFQVQLVAFSLACWSVRQPSPSPVCKPPVSVFSLAITFTLSFSSSPSPAASRCCCQLFSIPRLSLILLSLFVLSLIYSFL